MADWLGDHAEEVGGVPGQLAIGGESAGGSLAAVASQQRPELFRLQILIYPSTTTEFTFPSVDRNAEGYLLTKAWLFWFVNHYIGGLDIDPKDPLIGPLYASDQMLSMCPPAFVLTAGFDPLMDDGLAYAEKLEVNHVPVQRMHFEDQIHAFYGMGWAIPAADDALDTTAEALKETFRNVI